MVLPRFEVLEPKSISEVCFELSKLKDRDAALLAGGTDLLVDIRKKILPEHLPRCSGCPPVSGRAVVPKKAPEFLISLSRVSELKGIVEDESSISIGAMTTITDISESEIVRNYLTALAEGCDSLGSPLVRNRGTMGGNIANARPAADTFTPTIALNGVICVSSSKSSREIKAETFATGPGQTILKKDELITHFLFEKHTKRTGSAYYKLANRKALEISLVSVGAFITLSPDGKIIQRARVALGAVGPTPVISKNTGEYLEDKPFSGEVIKEAARLASEDANPITDHRGTKEYRMEMVEVITERVLNLAIERALKRI
ncbi:xanthine dehydrogenase family protein subunit M [bacterium]|nr:xanthine dehydrogenase family protein subunit M [bacterium]